MKDDRIAAFLELDQEQQVGILLELAQQITIWTRELYLQENVTEQYKQANESLHILLGHTSNLFQDNRARYPDAVFMDIILDCGYHDFMQRKIESFFDGLMLQNRKEENNVEKAT